MGRRMKKVENHWPTLNLRSVTRPPQPAAQPR